MFKQNVKWVNKSSSYKSNCFKNIVKFINSNSLFSYLPSFHFSKKNAQSKSNKHGNNAFANSSKYDRGFEEFLQNEDNLKKAKQKEKEERQMKKDENIQCLVLHPVFLDK